MKRRRKRNRCWIREPFIGFEPRGLRRYILREGEHPKYRLDSYAGGPIPLDEDPYDGEADGASPAEMGA